MNTCKECKFWDEVERSPNIIELLYGMGRCENEKLESYPEYKSDSFAAGEVLGSPCKPYTGPDFGCIHWEKK